MENIDRNIPPMREVNTYMAFLQSRTVDELSTLLKQESHPGNIESIKSVLVEKGYYLGYGRREDFNGLELPCGA